MQASITARHQARAPRAVLLGLTLVLGGCVGPWSPSVAPPSPSDSLTVQRLRGANPEVPPILPEPGNVWPEGQEAPRATLANPDEAMRNIPNYRPQMLDGTQPSAESGPPPRRARGSSSLPSEPIPRPPEGRPFVSEPAIVPPPPPRADGRPVVLPDGRMGVTTGGTDRVQGFSVPGGGTGTVVRDGRTETIIGPDGQVQQRIAPR